MTLAELEPGMLVTTAWALWGGRYPLVDKVRTPVYIDSAPAFIVSCGRSGLSFHVVLLKEDGVFEIKFDSTARGLEPFIVHTKGPLK